ncbi:hypothetical protein N658DRAFT_88391 [Parathielavia hyrcaniae]|uniref:Uncharacterized protein n=1 Tax=Parathielavia hyrcaniae TaxID=113614 RepID=A0AAN6Q381_9PEZI|nr:hypothetical protein N658DRAFT_88391 [Parathielavia hyrcaniae]
MPVSDDHPDDAEPQETDDKWTKCLRALKQVPDFLYLTVGRLVEDPASATIFSGAFHPEALDVILESKQFEDFLTTLGSEQPPVIFHTVDFISPLDLGESDMPRTTFAVLSFPFPATQEQRAGLSAVVPIPLPELYYEAAQFGRSSRTLGPRACRNWVRGPHKLPDGRDVEVGLMYQSWPKTEWEDAAATEELEKRESWIRGVTQGFGLLAISVERCDMYGYC